MLTKAYKLLVIKSKLQGGQYPKEKLTKIKSTFVKSMLMSEDIDDESEMIKQLKEKFHETQEKSVKIQILTLLPMSWSIKKIENEFKASNYMVRKAKTLVKSGVFCQHQTQIMATVCVMTQ